MAEHQFIQVKKNTLEHNPNGCIDINYHSSFICVNKDKKCKLDMREHNISEESFTEKHIKCDYKLTAQIKEHLFTCESLIRKNVT